MEEHTSHTTDVLFSRIEGIRVSNNKWVLWLVGGFMTVLLAIVGTNVQTHNRIIEALAVNSARIHVLQTVQVPPPEVLVRFDQLERDASNRERQLDSHINSPGHKK